MPPSNRPFMGAVPYDQGVTFRTWAPFASSVSVAGTFNGWSKTANLLFSEGNGYWSVDVGGARVRDQYKFFIVNRDTGQGLWKNDPYARELTNSAGNSVIADPDFVWSAVPYTTPPWNELVIYELHVGTFLFDATAPNGRGTFKSLITKLDYLRDLGVNAIEVMAAGEFPADQSWGYNQSYMFAIEQSYGGPNGFREMVDAAHQHGIAVIFDVVYNHIGPQDLDLWRYDGWGEHGGIYFYNDSRRFTDWGESRPDYGRPEVRQHLRDNALRWLEQRHVDGLRWDATAWIRNVRGRNNDPAGDLPDGWSLMQRINEEIGQRQPWKISIAEDLQENDWLTKEVAAGGAGFDAQWGADFLYTIRENLRVSADSARSMSAVREAVARRYNESAFERVVFSESHDAVAKEKGSRLPEAIWPGNAGGYFSQKRSTLGAALVFTSPGIPMIFQGQEFLADAPFDDAQQLDWTKAGQHSGITQLYRDLIRLRRNWFDTTRGLRGQYVNVHHVNDTDKLIAFHRWAQGGARDDVIVIVNIADRNYATYRVGLPRPGLWRVRFNSDWAGYSSQFGNHPSPDVSASQPGIHGMPFSGEVGIGPYTAIILSQDE